MRVLLECEKCGQTATVHRLSGGFSLRVDHLCDTERNLPVHPPYEKGPIHIDRGAREAAY